MPTPIENLTQNVNASSQRTVLQAVADDSTARQQAADKASAINAIVDNADQQALQNFFGGIAGDATAEDLLTSNNALIDKVSEDVDAIETLNTEESAIRKLLCRREGRNPANFADLDAVAADQGLMQAIAARQESSKILARSQKASAAAAAAATAMNEIGNSATAREEVIASSTALSEIRLIDQAIAKLTAGEAGLNASSYPDMATLAGDASAMQTVATDLDAMREMAASQTAMQVVASSQTAMQVVASSQTAMQEVAVSQPAMQEVAASQTAMQEVGTNSTAMQEVAASQTAIDAIGSNANASITENTVLNSATAFQELTSSPNLQTISRDVSNTFNIDGAPLTSKRVIVTSNNTNGGLGLGLSFVNDVGPELQSGSAFIANAVNINNGNSNSGANISIQGFEIN